MIAPKMIGLVRSPLGFALWNANDHLTVVPEERYVRASDCEYLLSVIDTLVEATGEHIDPDDQAIVAQIRADLKSQ